MTASPTARHAELARDAATPRPLSGASLAVYLLIGVYFGIVLTKAEMISWYRMQEMFRFQDLHMYGIIASALAVAATSIALMKARRIRTVRGDQIVIAPKRMDRGAYRYWIGGSIFGLGWALAGACPGPIFALLGNGYTVFLVNLAAAVLGTWVYGVLRPRLPH